VGNPADDPGMRRNRPRGLPFTGIPRESFFCGERGVMFSSILLPHVPESSVFYRIPVPERPDLDQAGSQRNGGNGSQKFSGKKGCIIPGGIGY